MDFGRKNSAIARALSRNLSTAPPAPAQPPPFPPSPPLPPPEPGTATYFEFWRALVVAAYGETIFGQAYRALSRHERLRKALELHETQRRERAAEARRSTYMGGGLLGLGALGALGLPEPEPEPEPAKLTRVRDHLARIEATARAEMGRLVEAQRSACELIRALGLHGALHAFTVDYARKRRPIQREAWGDAENWERLSRDRLFRAGTEAFDPPSVPCFPVATVEALAAFIAGRGEAGLRDVAGAARAVGAAPSDVRVADVRTVQPAAKKRGAPRKVADRIEAAMKRLEGEGLAVYTMGAKPLARLIREKCGVDAKPDTVRRVLRAHNSPN